MKKGRRSGLTASLSAVWSRTFFRGILAMVAVTSRPLGMRARL